MRKINRFTAWVLAGFAMVASLSSILGAIQLLHPATANAAALSYAQIVGSNQFFDNSGINCVAVLQQGAPPRLTDNNRVGHPALYSFGYATVSNSDADPSFQAAASSNVRYITFRGLDSANDSKCAGAMGFTQSVGGSSTVFYGSWHDGSFSAQVQSGSLSSLNQVLPVITAQVSTQDKTVTFTRPADSGNIKGNGFPNRLLVMKLDDPKNLFSNIAQNFPGGNGSGGTGSNCFENASSDALLKKCIDGSGKAAFINTNTIRYPAKNGDIYQADQWTGNTLKYKLKTPADHSRLTKGIPELDLSEDSSCTDINMDTTGRASDIADINRAFNSCTSDVPLTLHNYDVQGNQSTGTISAARANFRNMAVYYPKGPAVKLVFTTASGNESAYLGTYNSEACPAGSGQNPPCFVLSGAGLKGCDTSKPIFSLHQDPKTLSANSVVDATWHLPTSNNCEYADATVGVLVADANTDVPPDQTSTTPTTGSSPEINCSVTLFNPLSWFLCPLATALETVVSGLDNEINNYLDIPAGKASYPTDCGNAKGVPANDKWCGYYQAWRVVRNLSLGLMAVFTLVAIVSQALGFELLDAYTIRKVLPRLLFAAIAITLSWPLMMWFIGFTNDLGVGVRQLIYAPFSQYKVQLGGGGQFLIGFFGTAGIGVFLGFAGLLSFVATGALAAALAFLVLTLRQMLIVMLVIFAPIAIACYILPNTQKVWKLWGDSFAKGLMMFPIIAAFIAIGRVFAAVNSTGAGAINQIISFTAYFAPYFLLPFAFRLAGGAVSTIAGLANDRSRGVFDRLKKGRQERAADRFKRAQSQSLWDNNSAIGKRANKFASWATDPLSNAAYYGRDIPGLRKRGNKIAGQLEHAQVEQTQKLFEEINKMGGVNDKSLRALSGMHYDFKEPVKEQLKQAGLYMKTPKSLDDIQSIARIMTEHGEGTEIIGGQALMANAGRLATLYQDQEMTKANITGAGIMGLAAHGFATSADLANAANLMAGGSVTTATRFKTDKNGDYELDSAGNRISETYDTVGVGHASEVGGANSIIQQAALLGSRSRPEAKNGYGVMIGRDGKFIDGMSAEGGRMGAVLNTFSSQDLASAKGGAIKAVRPEIIKRIRAGGNIGKAQRDQVLQWVGPYSQASADVKAEALDIVDFLSGPRGADGHYPPGSIGADYERMMRTDLGDPASRGLGGGPDPGADPAAGS